VNGYVLTLDEHAVVSPAARALHDRYFIDELAVGDDRAIAAMYASICGIVYIVTLWHSAFPGCPVVRAIFNRDAPAHRAVHSIHSVYLLQLPTRSVFLSKRAPRTKTQVEDSMEFRIAKTDVPECDIKAGRSVSGIAAAVEA
jgi:hypothetical protein